MSGKLECFSDAYVNVRLLPARQLALAPLPEGLKNWLKCKLLCRIQMINLASHRNKFKLLLQNPHIVGYFSLLIEILAASGCLPPNFIFRGIRCFAWCLFDLYHIPVAYLSENIGLIDYFRDSKIHVLAEMVALKMDRLSDLKMAKVISRFKYVRQHAPVLLKHYFYRDPLNPYFISHFINFTSDCNLENPW